MPISFLEQSSSALGNPIEDSRLKARLLVREFASHRYGIFKESGFRHDPMYPAFSSLAGLNLSAEAAPTRSRLTVNSSEQLLGATNGHQAANIRGFDESWNECPFETSPASGLPTAQAAGCAPYLTKGAHSEPLTFNLMSSDPFSYKQTLAAAAAKSTPLDWKDIADGAKWHFCGENFPPAQPAGPGQPTDQGKPAGKPHPQNQQQQQQHQLANNPNHPHNQLAINKQNVMCAERSAMDVIRQSGDFSPANNKNRNTIQR